MWPDVGIKRSPNFSKRWPKISPKYFLFSKRCFQYPTKSTNIWATFVRKIVVKCFIKCPMRSHSKSYKHFWDFFCSDTCTKYFLFCKQLTANNCSIKAVDGWIRTWVLWDQKQPHCQLCHNHCPRDQILTSKPVSKLEYFYKINSAESC